MRDDLRALVTGRLGGPDAVLVVDETGDLKKGVHTVGVQRQYSGTAGRIENAQVGVFLGYAGRDGHTLIGRRVYLPVSWTEDRDRCRAAGVPDEVAATGELLRELALDLTQRYQRLATPPEPTPKRKPLNLRLQVQGFPMSRDITKCPRRVPYCM